MRALLSYRGWMFEQPRKQSTATLLWGAMLTLVRGPWASLYSHQAALPGMPVPSIKTTVRKYLDSVRSLLSEEEFNEVEAASADFVNTIAPRLNRYLTAKSWFTNYHADWWEKYVYLSGRSPIMINSNYYVLGPSEHNFTLVQSASCAITVSFILEFYRMLERETIQPIVIRNMIPMCMGQYERMFNTTRIPGKTIDELRHTRGSSHIVVMRRGRLYTLDTRSKTGRTLTSLQFQHQIEWIIADADERDTGARDGTAKLASMTGNRRDTWAEFRGQYLSEGHNKDMIDLIDTAIFCISLDHEQPTANDDVDELTARARSFFTGDGTNRWFDKSFTLIILPNGRTGMNVEHAWADAPVISHMWEYVQVKTNSTIKVDDEGNCVPDEHYEPPISHILLPRRIEFEFTEDAANQLNTSLEDARTLIADIDLRVISHSTYGKGFIKKCKVSPDAYIQLMLQTAYKRDTGDFALTYESSMTRIFRGGRTETVRAASKDSIAFIRSLYDADSLRYEKIELLRKSSETHTRLYREAMSGGGIDRHLFALCVVASGLGLKSKFLDIYASQPWRLSTSQQPQQQTMMWNASDPKWHGVLSPGGGFGPVTNDGYGVSYMVSSENNLYFHISSQRSSAITDSKRFANNLLCVSKDIQSLFL